VIEQLILIRGHQVKYLYLIQSICQPKHRYIGITSDPGKRLKEHNTGKSHHTSKYPPWKLAVTIRFEEDAKAFEFENYLKTGSGCAFANKHFW
jgi:predicted GIY-YIG superfamily endonuclease